MTTATRFADRLAGLLDGIRLLPDGWWEAVQLARPTDSAGPAEIWLGVGRHGDFPAAGEGSSICLNNKGASSVLREFPADPRSATDLVLGAADETVAAWRSTVGTTAGSLEILRNMQLRVEDASPDSVLALICFLLRLQGVAAAEVPSAWRTHVNDWEAGQTFASMSPYRVYGALHNALCHKSIFDNPGQAWRDGLCLMAQLMLAEANPIAIEPMAVAELEAARVLLAYEEQVYRNSLRSAELLQLAVPLRVGGRHRQIVDAYLSNWATGRGSFKSFLRSDHEASHLGRGFTVMAIWRAEWEGHGDDFAVSTDPAAMLDLSDFWTAAENAEWSAWSETGEARPADRPRRLPGPYAPRNARDEGLRQRLDVKEAPNEPWYHDPDYSLVATPRAVDSDRMGSKLGWVETLSLLWSVYNPYRDQQVRWVTDAADGVETDPMPLHRPTARTGEEPSGKRLLIGRWVSPEVRAGSVDGDFSAFQYTPTLGRYLAAILERDRPLDEPVDIHDLPPLDTLRKIDLWDGFAVVTPDGACVLVPESWRDNPLGEIERVFASSAGELCYLEGAVARTERIVADLQSRLGRGVRSQSDHTAFDALCAEEIKSSQVFSANAGIHQSPEAARFSMTLHDTWGIGGQLERFNEDVRNAKDLVFNYSQLRANRRVELLTVYGFPILLSATLFAFIFSDIDGSNPDWTQVNWPGAGLFVLVSAIGLWLMNLLASRSDGASPGPGNTHPSAPNRDAAPPKQ